MAPTKKDDRLYEIVDVVGHEIEDGKTKFLVLWVKNSSWSYEPIEMFTESSLKDTVVPYLRRHSLKANLVTGELTNKWESNAENPLDEDQQSKIAYAKTLADELISEALQNDEDENMANVVEENLIDRMEDLQLTAQQTKVMDVEIKVFRKSISVPFFFRDNIEMILNGRILTVKCQRAASAVFSGQMSYELKLPNNVDGDTVEKEWIDEKLIITANWRQ